MVDVVMQRHVGDVGTFDAQLSGLVEQGITSTRERGILEAALDAGNAAADRGHLAGAEDVETVIDIVENMLQGERLVPAAERLRQLTTPAATAPVPGAWPACSSGGEGGQ